MKTEIREHLIDRLAAIFGKPKNADALAANLAPNMDGVTAGDLDALAGRIIESRKATSFPSASELLTLVKAISVAKAAGGTAGSKERTGIFDPVTRHEKRTKERTYRLGGQDRWFGYGSRAQNQLDEARAEAEKRAISFLLGQPLTDRAYTEGWLVGLFSFAIQEGREPDAAEERRIVGEVRANDADVRNFPPHPDTGGLKMRGQIQRLRAEMHAKTARLLGCEQPRPAKPASHRNLTTAEVVDRAAARSVLEARCRELGIDPAEIDKVPDQPMRRA